jgi:hypothetical protein
VQTTWREATTAVLIAILPLLAILAGMALLLTVCTGPSDRVFAIVTNIPNGTDRVVFLSDFDDEVQCMDWYEEVLPIWNQLMKPMGRIAVVEPDAPNQSWKGGRPVQWRYGKRYGVALRAGGSWRVIWYKQDDLSLGRKPLGESRRTLTIDLPNGRAEPLPEQEVQRLGLHEAPPQ